MSGRVFVHIGLPKTATTTLQAELFPALSGTDIHYYGVYQPRNCQAQEYLYERFCEAVFSGRQFEEARSAIASELSAGKSILISEEMITVSAKEASWCEKLDNLSKILCDLDYVLIVTVREPAGALFSYYVELNEQFAWENKSFLELAKFDDRMQIFHYRKLIHEILKRFNKEQVFIKKFEEIVNGKLEELCRLVAPGKEACQCIKQKTHNEKRWVDNVVYTGKKFTLADVVRHFLVSTGMNNTAIVGALKGALSPVIGYLDKFALSDKKVSRPSEEEMSELRDFLKQETAALDEHFGVKYE